jgi:alkylation response protein AidB-like acyl-CoA dehydrogenase
MDFSLSMEQDILRDSVRQFAEKEIRPVAGEFDEKEEIMSLISLPQKKLPEWTALMRLPWQRRIPWA